MDALGLPDGHATSLRKTTRDSHFYGQVSWIVTKASGSRFWQEVISAWLTKLMPVSLNKNRMQPNKKDVEELQCPRKAAQLQSIIAIR